MKNMIKLIGIAGGTGSGKTSVARELLANFNNTDIVIIEQDSYYKDFSELPLDDRSKINFDHPNSIDYKLLKVHLEQLLNGEEVEIPIYDYGSHIRKNETQKIGKHKIIILEGILALHDQDIRNMMDIKIYVDTDDDIRIIRRIKRDMNKRKRTFSSIIDQYCNTVKPMHNQFVNPTKKFADIVIVGGGKNQIAIDILKTKIITML